MIELGGRQRFFVGAAREAALLADPGCVVTGCSIVGGRVQIDHTRGWARTEGPTSQSNAGAICAHHNRIKEELGLILQREPTIPGVWNTYRIDGSQIGFRTSPATSPLFRDSG